MIERLAIIGLGSIGRRHLRLAREILPDTQITVVTRGDSNPPARPANDEGVITAVADVEACLATAPQGAVVANPATMHLQVALRLAQAGVHLLVEKPISSSAAGVRELLETVGERGNVLMVGYNLRFQASLRNFRDLLLAGAAGRLYSVRAEVGQWLPAWRAGVDYRGSVSASSRLGGGVLLELSHEIDYLRWIFGPVEWVSAVQLRQGELEIDVEDTAHLTLGFPGSHGRAMVAALSMDFIRQDATRRCTAIGSDGSLRWDGIEDTVEIFEPGPGCWRTLFRGNRDPDECYRAQLVHFADCIAGCQAPLVPGADGLAVVEVVDAARRSSQSGSIVRLAQPGVERGAGGAT